MKAARMKPAAALLLLTLLLSACATRPPLPPGCDGPLTPINASSDSGESDAQGRRP